MDYVGRAIERFKMSVWWSPTNKCWFAHAENGLTKSGGTMLEAVFRAVAVR